MMICNTFCKSLSFILSALGMRYDLARFVSVISLHIQLACHLLSLKPPLRGEATLRCISDATVQMLQDARAVLAYSL